jgi:DDE superfamily endonuclease
MPFTCHRPISKYLPAAGRRSKGSRDAPVGVGRWQDGDLPSADWAPEYKSANIHPLYKIVVMAVLVAPQRLRDFRIAELRWRLGRIERRQQLLLTFLMLEEEQRAQQQRRRRTCWVRPWLQRRVLLGQYDTLMNELRMEDRGGFKSFLRMDCDIFLYILERIEPRITKCQKNRAPLSPGIKLAITLRFLATGISYRALEFDFRVAHNTISLFVPQVCQAIIEEFRDEQWATPSTEEEWQEVAEKFSARWNFHHACGALDGKHIRIRKPRKSGSLYYNYKGFFSIVLLGLVDAEYKFLWVNVGSPGSYSDCGVFNRSQLEPGLRQGTLAFPRPSPLPNDDRDIPYFLVGDDAFPLRTYMMKPYSDRLLDHDQRIFNYRCSRARRVVENAFGILASRFRCLHSCLWVKPRVAAKITKACVTLHNVLRDQRPAIAANELDVELENGDIVPGAWRDAGVLEEIRNEGRGPRQTVQGKELRAYLKAYYNSDVGSVPWQEAAITPRD